MEVFTVCRASGTVQQSDEIIEKRVRAAQGDEDDAIVLRIERVGLFEVFPEIANRLLTLVVDSTDGEATLHLPDESCGRCARTRADNEEIVGVEAQMLGLKIDFGDNSVGQDGRDASDEELSQPVRCHVLFEEYTLVAGRDWA